MVDKELTNRVVEVRCKSIRITPIKLLVKAEVLNVICVYAPQVGLADDIKKVFWEEMEEVLQIVPQNEKLFLGGKADRCDIRMEVLGMGKEIVDGCQFWTLL